MFEMWAVWLSVTGVALSAAIFIVTRLFEVSAARQEQRRKVVSRVLDSVDRLTRAVALWPLSGIWTRPALELMVVVPRILMDLPKRDDQVAVWVLTQVNEVAIARTRKEAFTLAQGIGVALAEWHRGTRPTKWFVAQTTQPFTWRADPDARGRRVRELLQVVLSAMAIPVLWGALTEFGRRHTSST